MRFSEKWKDYELIDTSDGERLERWGDIILIRPDPQIIWSSGKKNPLWHSAHARYHRSNKGGGHWEAYKKVPERWTIGYRDLIFNIKPMGFKHTGVFPEQAVNWDSAADIIQKSDRPLKILNLFGYTGCATLACMKAGAAVTHVDASKGMVQWAKENAQSSGIADKPVRWLVDDCVKFVQREIRRGNKYDGIIMDPPSYGRGPGGEVWKLEEQLYPLVDVCIQVLSDDPEFFILNSYTTGLSPAVMEYFLNLMLKNRFGGKVSSGEIGLKVTETGLILPCGSTSVWTPRFCAAI
ncbi:MAG: class I SAM-dependent methyltransferase [Ruminococcus sp.]|nr:class I SAM-dependent methyltransferase [Ruminococcus sp.]